MNCLGDVDVLVVLCLTSVRDFPFACCTNVASFQGFVLVVCELRVKIELAL